MNINKVHRKCIEEKGKIMNALTAELGNKMNMLNMLNNMLKLTCLVLLLL